MRSYSLTGAALESDRRSYTIAVRHVRRDRPSGEVAEGLVSGHVHRELKVGQLVSLKAPGGSFVMPFRSRQPVVLFAGGIGITPFLCYLETLARRSEAPDVWLFYANRSRRTQAFKRRIAALQQRLPSLKVVNCYAAPGEAGCDMSGRLSADVVDESLVRQRAKFYFCGPEPMMDSITHQLVARGVPPFDIFREVFKSPSVPKLDPDSKVRCHLHQGAKDHGMDSRTWVVCFLSPSNAGYQSPVAAG